MEKSNLTETLELAVKHVDVQMQKDATNPLLEDQLKLTTYATVSGMNDFDYQVLSSTSEDDHSEKQLASVKMVPLPDELIEQFSHMQCNCIMGIFPDIHRSWLAIDSDIYFWVYEDGSDVAYYDGIKEVILAAGLVTPRAGVFHDHIKFLLCITTPINIYILGVSFLQQSSVLQGNVYGTIELHPEPLFVIATDNVYMTSICGTANGRIFLAGKDSCLYEVVYQSQKKWFGKQCYKVNHSSSSMSFLIPSFVSSAFSTDDPICQLAVDNSRGLLYCRTENGNIKVYHLGDDLSGMSCVTAITNDNACKQAHYIARNVDKQTFKKIIHVAPVPKSDSTRIHLVAITDSGARLYFVTSHQDGSPGNLNLFHLRMPPGYTPSLSPDKPTNVHAAFYRKGTSLLLSGVTEDMDRLWCLNQDMFPFRSPVKETQSALCINGHTWCLMEISETANPSASPRGLFTDFYTDPPAVVTQHVLPPRRYVLLSAQGSHIITTSRPIEQLKSLLFSTTTGESDAINAFFQQHGADQACAALLVLICQSHGSDRAVADVAVQSFFGYGADIKGTPAQPVVSGNVSIMPNISSPVQGGSSQGSFLATPQVSGYQKPMATPKPPNLLNSTSVATSPQPDKDVYSAKHNGLILYFSRILKPIWTRALAVSVSVDMYTYQLYSSLTTEELLWFIEQLNQLKQFVDRYSVASGSPSQSYQHRLTLAPQSSAVPYEQCLGELKSLQAFKQLLLLSIEALELWRIMSVHQFYTIIEAAPPEVTEKLKQVVFKDMFTNAGRELSSQLINCLMSKCLNDNSMVDSISATLREKCPSLFSANDALLTKANETLVSASSVHSQVEKERILEEAIQLFSGIPDMIDLQWICEQLKKNLFYDGIVSLCLSIASKRDPLGVALHYYKSGEPREDIEGKEIFVSRQEAYNVILKTLEELVQSANVLPEEPGLPTQSGPPPPVAVQIVNGLAPDLARKYFDRLLLNGLNCNDELFHVTLYEWLVKENKDQILEIKSPYLENYLLAVAAETHPNNKPTLDLLWKYYERNGNFMAAAKVLMKLAEREGPLMNIHNRLEYLSRAVMSTKSCSMITTGSAEGEFLHEIEEKLEVAQIQLKIFDEINQKDMIQAKKDEALNSLNSHLLDISALYGDYAEAFSLPECKLVILLSANHIDENLINQVWYEMITKVFDDSRTMRSTDRVQYVTQQLVHLGKIYSQHKQYFPVYFLLFSLECKSCELKWDVQTIFDIFQQVGLPFSALHQHYGFMFQAKDKVWKNLGQPLHILDVISQLFLTFIQAPPKASGERTSLTRSVYEATTAHLVELEAMDNTEASVKNLTTQFKGIQAKLKRM